MRRSRLFLVCYLIFHLGVILGMDLVSMLILILVSFLVWFEPKEHTYIFQGPIFMLTVIRVHFGLSLGLFLGFILGYFSFLLWSHYWVLNREYTWYIKVDKWIFRAKFRSTQYSSLGILLTPFELETPLMA